MSKVKSRLKVCILLTAGIFAVVLGRELLYRVDQPAEALSRLGLPVVQGFNGYSLLLLDEREAGALPPAPPPRLLIENPREKLLLYVLTPEGFNRATLRNYGEVLTADPAGVLLATDDSQLPLLNRLPVELCRINLEPYPQNAAAGPAPLPFAVPDSLVREIVSRVDADSLLEKIRRLQNFYTRYSTTDSCRQAVAWMGASLAAYGCDSVAFEDYLPGYAPNCIGVKFGRENPRQIYVLCGHIDNTSDQAPNRCPGSDDNGSGAAAVLEAARAFQGLDFACTVYFIGFTGEEQGLFGSDSFAARAFRRGDSIRGVLNFDMISYGRENRDTLNVIGKISNPDCAWLVDSFIANARTYTALKTRRRLVTSYPASDHHSFWLRGYVALLGIERDFTPMYHTIGDTIGPLYYQNCGTNNWPMAAEAVRAACATLAKLAGALPGTGTAEETATRPGRFLRVTPSLGKRFRVQTDCPVITVFDALGTRIVTRKLENGQWDATDRSGNRVRPGVYLLRDAGGRTARVVVTR